MAIGPNNNALCCSKQNQLLSLSTVKYQIFLPYDKNNFCVAKECTGSFVALNGRLYICLPLGHTFSFNFVIKMSNLTIKLLISHPFLSTSLSINLLLRAPRACQRSTPAVYASGLCQRSTMIAVRRCTMLAYTPLALRYINE